jgi:hypothetical protein
LKVSSLVPLWSLWRGGGDAPPDQVEAPEDLVACLETATDVGRRFAEHVAASIDHQPLANAASICRWEILQLRERVVDLEVPRPHQSVQSEVVRRLDEAAAAARLLSSGHRFHNLERICDGGQALDDNLAALTALKERLAGG